MERGIQRAKGNALSHPWEWAWQGVWLVYVDVLVVAIIDVRHLASARRSEAPGFIVGEAECQRML